MGTFIQKSPTQIRNIPSKSKEKRRADRKAKFKQHNLSNKEAKRKDETFPVTLTAEAAEEGN